MPKKRVYQTLCRVDTHVNVHGVGLAPVAGVTEGFVPVRPGQT